MENAILKRESKKLAQDFENIIKNNPDAEKSDISNLLMARLCLETIYLPKTMVESYEKSDTVTIDPSQAKLEWELDEEEKKKDYWRIRAYSFGPFNPIEYFKSKLRILWLLKEPYCECIDEITGTKIKDFRQALQYATWEKAKGNPTIRNLIMITQELLKKMKAEEKEVSSECDFAKEDLNNENVVMNHICILEVNHFPGLAFDGTNSNNNLIGEWGTINYELIRKLIDFYNPNLIYYHKENCARLCIPNNLIKVALENDGERVAAKEDESTRYLLDDFCNRFDKPITPSILGRNILRSWFKKDIFSESGNKKYEATLLLDEMLCLWVCFEHPSFNWPDKDNVIGWVSKIFKECRP